MNPITQQRIAGNLAAGILTMREACDQAERLAANGDGRAVRRVLHSLAWGFANASSAIEGAMIALEDEQATRAVETEEADRMRAALNDIASWDEGPVVDSSFDEPWSTRIARAALAPAANTEEVTG